MISTPPFRSKRVFCLTVLFYLGLVGLFPPSAAAQNDIALEIWYGDNETVSDDCLTQQYVNILGRVTSSSKDIRLTYRLNSAPPREIEVGPNLFRLAADGDFNIDISVSDLADGQNEVEITAENGAGDQAIHTVIVNRERSAESLQPPDQQIRWEMVNLSEGPADVIDGRWEITPEGIRSVEPGYDRLVALCPMSWQNFELTVPVTVHAIEPRKEWPSNGSGVGVAFHWNGHEDWNDIQPDYGWYPIGGFNVLSWDYAGGRTEPHESILLNGNEYWPLDESVTELQIGQTYMFKLRSEHVPGYGSLYKSKVWLANEPEPADWLLRGHQYTWHPFYGSILLVSHHADATFGTIEIKNLDNSMLNRLLNLLPFIGMVPLLVLGLVAVFQAASRRNRLPAAYRQPLLWAGIGTLLFAIGKPLSDFVVPRFMHDLNFNFEYISVALTAVNLLLAGLMLVAVARFFLLVSRRVEQPAVRE